MRKSWLLVKLIIWGMLFVAMVCLSEEASARDKTPATKPIELKFSNFVPQATAFATYFIEPWGYMIERGTRGKVKMIFYHGGALAGPMDAYETAEKGIADIAWTNIAYEAGRWPKLEVFSLPFMCGEWGRNTSMALWKMYPEYFADEFKDVKLLFIYATQANVLYTTKKQVKKLDDLKGMKIAVHPLGARAVGALGAAPVPMPGSQFYEALEKGMVDGVFSDDQMVQAYRIDEVLKYSTRLPLYALPCPYVMNLKKYNSLPDDVKGVVNAMSGTLGVHNNGIQAEFAMLRSRMALEKRGMQFFTLPESDIQKAVSLVQPLVDDWVSGMEKKGLPGRKLVDEAKKGLEEYKYIGKEYWY